MQLAIDTSTNTAGLALVQDNKVLEELTWECEQNHTVLLMPHLKYLLDKANLDLQTAECIIVARGPGSYNGLRVGITTAKTLAFSLGIPIIGISTLEVEAYQHAGTGLPVCPIFNAGREEIATATYQQKKTQWRQVAEEHLTTIDDLCSETKAKTLFCGEFAPVIVDRLTENLKEKAIIPAMGAGLRRAGFLAELGLKRFQAGDYDNTVTLQPSYFRGPSITKPKNRSYREGIK